MTVDVSFYVKDFDVVQLRSHLRPEDEHAIEDLAIWVFDRAGNRYGDVLVTTLDSINFEALGTSPTSTDGSVGKGVDFGGTKQLGDISKLLKLRLKSTSDELTVVALANFKSANFALEDATTGDKYNSEEQFKKIKTLDELKALTLNINQGNDEYTTTQRFESPLMYAVHTVTVDDVREGSVKIPLIPYIAKFTATVKADPKVTINSISIHLENIPTKGNLFSALSKTQLPVTDLNLRNTHEEFLPALSDGTFVSTGYLMPNYAKPKAQITKEIVAQAQARKKGNGTGYTAFDLRQKRVKEDAAGGYVENKEWQYAPDEATTLVIDAELTLKDADKEQRAVATYTVLLGDFSGVSSWTEPTEEDLLKINNYLIESATHYKYTITIKGVDNIIVEAESADKLDEPNPSVEGTVIGNKPTFELDSHYEQRTFLLSSTDFDIFKDPNTRELKEDAKLQFMVQTPFEPLKFVTYTASEAQKARIGGVPEDKVVDNDWIRIYVHDPLQQDGQVFDNNNLPQIIYSKTMGDVEKGTSVADFWEKTLTVEQFFAWVLEDPDPLFDKHNSICITMFVDEYFYQWDPKKVKKEDRTSANADRDLWKTFCNAPDRKFFLFTGDLRVSADQNSRFTEGTYLSVTQHSIKTIFTQTADGLRIWGVESIDEHPNRFFTEKGPGEPAMWYNVYYSNGWSNTWNLLAGDSSTPGGGTTAGTDGGWIKGGKNLIMRQKTILGQQNNYWSAMTIGTANGVDMRDTKNYQAVYSPLSRNRDVNRDDKMQASELKWYIPAANEVMILALAESFLPAYAKLDVKRTETNLRNYPNAPLVLYSSTMFRNNALSQYSSNPIVFLPENFCHLSIYEVMTDPSFYNAVTGSFTRPMANFYSTTRLIRDLGVVEDEVTETGHTYHMLEGERTENLNTFMVFKPKHADPNKITEGQSDRASGEFRGGFHFPAATRTSFVDGELPTHTEKDTAIKIYKKGFKVAGSFAYINSSGGTAAERYTMSYDELNAKLLLHSSPCRGYYEETDRSDLGKWRLPNIMELGLMGTSMPRDYWFTVHEKFNGTTKKYIWSATTPSFDTKPMSKSTNSNLFLYIDQQLFWTMNFKVKTYGVPASKAKGYVRCVRDIED